MTPWPAIFAIAPDCHASNTGHYARLWKTHFYEGIASAGVTVITPREVDYSWSFRSSAPDSGESEACARTNEHLARQIQAAIDQNGVRAVISYARSRQIDPTLVAQVQKRGIPWINFFCDSISQFEDVRALASAASLNWFPESLASESYRVLGKPFLCRPYALNFAEIPKIDPSAPSQNRVGFVGLPSTNRVTVLSLLALLGCPLEIHGYGWDSPQSSAFSGQSNLREKLRRALVEPHRMERIWRRIGWRYIHKRARGPLDDSQLFEFLAECRIVLGLNEARMPSGRLQSYLKFRDVEMPAHGCCYLTQHNPDICSILEPEREVLLFENVFEAHSRIKFYSARPDLCRRIGAAARERILREHNWEVRLRELQTALAGRQT